MKATALAALLLVAAASARAQVVKGPADTAAALADDDRDLDRRWMGDDVAAGRRLIARARRGGGREVMDLSTLSRGGTKGIAALHDELAALAREAGQSTDIDARHGAGDLMRAVQHWESFDSPQAQAGAESFQAAARRERLWELFCMFLMPVTVVAGALWVVWSRSFVIWLLIGRSTALSRAFGDAGKVVEREHRAALLLPAAAAVTAVVVATTVWEAMSLVTPATTPGAAFELAWRAVFSAKVLTAYFCAGFAFYFMHAMFLSMMIDVAGGLRPDFGAAFARARARAKEIFVLSAAVFAGLLLVEFGLRQARRWLSYAPAGEMITGVLGLAAWLLETGVTIASVLLLAIALGDGVPFVEAGRRATRVLTTQARPALLSLFGIDALQADVVGAPVFAVMVGGIWVLPISMVVFGEGYAQRLGLPLGFTEAHLVFYGAAALAVIVSGWMYSGVLAMESIGAAALYCYGKDDAVQGPLIATLRELAPGVEGVLNRLER